MALRGVRFACLFSPPSIQAVVLCAYIYDFIICFGLFLHIFKSHTMWLGSHDAVLLVL